MAWSCNMGIKRCVLVRCTNLLKVTFRSEEIWLGKLGKNEKLPIFKPIFEALGHKARKYLWCQKMRINRIYNIAIHHIQIKWHLTRKIPGKVSFFSIFNFHLFEKFFPMAQIQNFSTSFYSESREIYGKKYWDIFQSLKIRKILDQNFHIFQSCWKRSNSCRTGVNFRIRENGGTSGKWPFSLGKLGKMRSKLLQSSISTVNAYYCRIQFSRISHQLATITRHFWETFCMNYFNWVFWL